MLFGCYPNGSPRDPEIYGTAVVGLLAKYPAEIILQVCDPIDGLPTKCSFLPTIAELSKALNEAMKPIWDEQRRLRREQQRREAEAMELSKPTPEERERVGKMLADLSKNLGTGMRTFVK